MTHHHHQPPPPSHHHPQPPHSSHNHHLNHQPPHRHYDNEPPPPHPSHNNLTPPPSYHHHHHRRRNNHHSSSASIKGCCCCLILLFSFLALLLLTILLLLIFAVKPKKPNFSLQQVTVQYINLATAVATAAPTSASLSLAVRMLFTARNDNKVGIKYGVSTFNIMYRGIPLGRGSVPGFYQPAHSLRRVETTVTVDRVNLLQADAADLVRDATVNDRVELRIIGDVNAKIRILGLTSPSVQVNFFTTFF